MRSFGFFKTGKVPKANYLPGMTILTDRNNRTEDFNKFLALKEEINSLNSSFIVTIRIALILAVENLQT